MARKTEIMNLSDYCVDEPDEERATRSVLVSNLPPNSYDKVVIIHFQKGKHGGGDVDSVRFPDPEDNSTAIVTFEDPKTVETVLNCTQEFNGRRLAVQRYPVVQRPPPEVFSEVTARLNADVFNCIRAVEELMGKLKKATDIEWQQTSYGVIITGSYKQIRNCHSFLQDYLQEDQQSGDEGSREMPDPYGHGVDRSLSDDPMDQEPHLDASSSNSTLESLPSKEPTKIEPMTYQVIPIVYEFLTTTSNCKGKLRAIEEEFSVDITSFADNTKVTILPAKSRCTPDKYTDACEEYIKLYQDTLQNSMHREEIVLGSGSGFTHMVPSEAVDQVTKQLPVLAIKGDRPDSWLFYGEERFVEAAKRMAFEAVGIEDPNRRKRRGKSNQTKSDKSVTGRHEESPGASHAGMQSTAQLDIPPSKGSTSDKVEFLTKKGFKISVYQGDITDEQVDVIVSTVDEYLGCNSGLARALVAKAGSTIRVDLGKIYSQRRTKPGDYVVTRPGKLMCKKIFHAIAPQWEKNKNETCKKLIQQVCYMIIKGTEKTRFTSIAFPAIGTGAHGVPLDFCASAMVSSVEEYMKDKSGTVCDIRFVHIDSQAVEVFKSELMKRFSSSQVLPTPSDSESADSRDTRRTDVGGTSQGPSESRDNLTKDDVSEDENCPICLDTLTNPMALDKCGHKFCKECIDKAFRLRKACPTCGLAYGVQQGNMPNGRMDVGTLYMSLPGYPGCGTIQISYSFYDGTQGPDHPNPGRRYYGTRRIAFLPDNSKGREVLGLLKKAFDARLTFTIGMSVTTGQSDVVTWNDIHHKTNTHGGSTGFGYPDPTYLDRVKDELAAKGIR